MKTRLNTILALGAGLAPLCMAPAALAQTAVTPAQADDTSGIAAIVVTAQRRSENLQQTPLAVTALSPQVLVQRNVQTAMDLMRVAPGLEVSTASSGQGTAAASFFIRGMGQQRSTNGTSPAVGVYVDDFYYPSLDGQIFNIIDLQQVEVLRGPQGTLFGRDTIGGAIRYTSEAPDFHTISGHLSGTYGSYNRHDITGAINVPLADNAAIRVTVGTLGTDGFVRRADGQPDAGATASELARVQFKWAPASTVDIDLGAQYTRSRNYGVAYAIRSINVNARTAAAWNAAHAGQPSQLFNSQWISQCAYCQPGSDVAMGADTHYVNGTGKVTWHVADNLTIKSLTSFQKVNNYSIGDTDGTPLPIQDVTALIDNNKAWSQELQFSGTNFADRLNWVAGLYYYRQTWYAQQYTQQFNTYVAPNPYIQHTTTKAGFVDLTFKLTDALRVIGGIRYSEDSTDVNLSSPGGAVLAQGNRTFPSTTGRAGLQMQWAPKFMTYATISRGFRAGGFSQDNGYLSSFNPETATNFEIGARTDWLDGKLRLNPTVFYTKWDNIQIQWQTFAGFTPYFIIQNAAKAHSYGAELEGEAAVTSSLRLFGNVALLHVQYDSVGSAQGITVNSQFERAPAVTYTLGARHQARFDNGFTLRTTVNWNWHDVQYSTPGDADHLRLPAYGVLGARIELVDPSSKWTLAVFGTNLTNKLYYVGGVDYASFIGESKWDLGRPREVGVSIRRNF